MTSDLQSIISKCDIEVAYRSDHSPISLSVQFNTHEKGSGTWKFNNALLYDKEYIASVKTCIAECVEQYGKNSGEVENLENIEFSITDQLFWETLKLLIRGKTISYSSFKKKERSKEEKELENQLKKLNDEESTEENRDKLTNLELKLRTVRESKIKGAIMRAKAKWQIEGERSTKYFCNLEKRNFIEKVIPSLILDNGEIVKDQNRIRTEQKLYYQELYISRKTNITDEHKKNFFSSENPFIKILNEEQRRDLEGEISSLEMHTALKNMKNGKSPGLDGFTTEFYNFFWHDIKYFLLRSFREAFQKGNLSISQTQGIITCLPKDGKPKHFLKNWRPISLLNVDYKIIATCIANRIKKVLNYLISETQTGFMKGRYIGECTRLIYDLIEKTNEEDIPGLLVLLDFEKAFDSLEWNFISEALKFLGLGDTIVKWFETLYKKSQSCIQNNGHLSDFFPIQRGVRQGDPLSPYLFILCLELLSASIKFDNDINGIKIQNSEYLLSQYADDSTLFLDDNEVSLNSALNRIAMFASCSGLRANFDKTQVVWIGARRGCGVELKTDKKIMWNHTGNFKLLGIQYCLGKNNIYMDNYVEKIQKVKNLLSDWSFRNISIYGKITVIKTLVLPILVQCFTVLPNPSQDLLKDLQSICFKFVWDGKVDKIKRIF